MALLAAMGALDPDGPWDMGDLDAEDPRGHGRTAAAWRPAATSPLRTLDDRPLPDEEFSWIGIPDDVHDKVAATVAMCDALLR